MRGMSFWFCLGLVGCGVSSEDSDSDTGPIPNPYAVPESCPELKTGTVELEVDGQTRVLEVELPTNPQGAPVVFAWHWLGGNATQILDLMGMRRLAGEGYIVIAPESSGLQFEWDSSTRGRQNPDLALLDDVLGCSYEQFTHDPDAVYATGMSAGGLFSTFLTFHRADVLAATAIFSGGTDQSSYVTPAREIPVLVTWGGPTDTYGGFQFEAASQLLISSLEADGSPAFPCVHSLGHLPPPESLTMVKAFFGAHHRGEESPWLSGPPESLPSYCSW